MLARKLPQCRSEFVLFLFPREQQNFARIAMEYLLCLSQCFKSRVSHSRNLTRFEQVLNQVTLDTSSMGRDAVVIEKRSRICGSGGAVSNFPIVQDKAYFEAKVQQNGVFGVGLSTGNSDLNSVPLGTDNQSWVLRQDGKIVHNNQVQFEADCELQEGDIIGVAYDHVHLKFLVNNQPIDYELANIKGQVLPVVYVTSGAIIDMQFNAFSFAPPAGYDAILIEKILL